MDQAGVPFRSVLGLKATDAKVRSSQSISLDRRSLLYVVGWRGVQFVWGLTRCLVRVFGSLSRLPQFWL